MCPKNRTKKAVQARRTKSHSVTSTNPSPEQSSAEDHTVQNDSISEAPHSDEIDAPESQKSSQISRRMPPIRRYRQHYYYSRENVAGFHLRLSAHRISKKNQTKKAVEARKAKARFARFSKCHSVPSTSSNPEQSSAANRAVQSVNEASHTDDIGAPELERPSGSRFDDDRKDFHFDDIDFRISRISHLLELTIDTAREIFHLHGGIFSPPFLPSDTIEMSPAPFDYRESFASYLVDDPHATNVKRYTFNEISYESSFMKSSTSFKCARFDIVKPSSTTLTMEAEALAIVCEFLERFSDFVQMDDFVIRLNHSSLVPPVMDYLYRVRYQMTRLVNPEKSCINFALKEYSSLPCIHDIDIEEWEQIQNDRVEKDSPLLSHIFHLKRRDWISEDFYKDSFNDLKVLVDLLKSFDIKCPVVIAPNLMKNYRYSKIMFQVVLKDSVNYGGLKSEVVAAGGRYDGLIELCERDSGIESGARQSAVGVTIYLDQFVEILGPLTKFEVLVCSADSNELLKEKLDLAKKIWAAKIRCTISYAAHNSLEEIQEYCRKMKIDYALFLEKSNLERVTLCSQIHGGRFHKEVFAVKEVVPYLKNIIQID